jgi:hypothetical protein
MAIPLRPRRHPASRLTIRTATPADVSAMLELSNEQSSRRQLAPVCRAGDFDFSRGPLLGLAFENVLLAEANGKLMGMVAGWDQHPFRQTIVEGYSGWLRLALPWLNRWRRLTGEAPLPPTGEPIRCLLAALVAVRNDDPTILAELIGEVQRRWSRGPWSHLLVGMHESEPLAAIIRPQATMTYETMLYLVSWSAERPAMGESVPIGLELGSM